MNDSHGLVDRDRHEFKQVPGLIGSDDEQTVFAVLLELDQPQRVLPRMMNVGVGDAVPPGRVPEFHV